jgi:SNF family Na+-dependent transporter
MGNGPCFQRSGFLRLKFYLAFHKPYCHLSSYSGVGYTAALASFLMSSFYCCIMGWAVCYMVYSFFIILPWNRTEWWTVDFGYIQVNKDPEDFYL